MVVGWHTEFLMTLDDSYMYSRFPITQTFLGNEKRLELLGVQVIKSLKEITKNKEISKWQK